MKKAIVILLALLVTSVAFAADPLKDLDTVDYVMDAPSRMVISGELTADTPTWHRWRGDTWSDIGLNCDLLMTFEYSNDPHFDQYCFNVTTDDPVEFVVDEAEFDTVIYIYCDPFDPDNSTENGVYGDDDDGVGLLSAITADNGVSLVPGNDYWFILCSYSAGNTGTYSVTTSENVVDCDVVDSEMSTWSNMKGMYR